MKGLAKVMDGLARIAAIEAAGPVDVQAAIDAAQEALAAARVAQGEMLRRHAAEVEAAERALVVVEEGIAKMRAELRPVPRSAAKQAGPAAVRLVVELLRVGAASQKQVVERTGLNEGTASYAVRALRESGAVELTGRKVDGSRELRLVAGGQAAVADAYREAREIVAGSAKVPS